MEKIQGLHKTGPASYTGNLYTQVVSLAGLIGFYLLKCTWNFIEALGITAFLVIDDYFLLYLFGKEEVHTMSSHASVAQ